MSEAKSFDELFQMLLDAIILAKLHADQHDRPDLLTEIGILEARLIQDSDRMVDLNVIRRDIIAYLKRSI